MSTVIKVEIRPFYTLELAQLYKMNEKTFNKNIKAIRTVLGKRNGYRWNVRQVILICKHMDIPYELVEPDGSTNIKKTKR